MSKAMGTRVLCCSVLLLLQIMNWVSATSKLLPPNGAHIHHAHPPDTDESGPKQSFEAITNAEEVKHQEQEEEAAAYKEMKKIGSRPPNCESKCYGCNPCVAIQVPTINGHFSLQYANYLPEGWKCKCGPSFYSP